MDDIYAVFRNGSELKLESCPRLVARRWRLFGSGTHNPFQRVCQTHTLKLSAEPEATEWYSYIKGEISPVYTKPLVEGGPSRHLLVVVNPIGGKGKGEEIFHELLKPMLVDCGTPYMEIITTGPGHAEKVAKTFDPSVVGAVAIVGGDGLFGEFLNGVNARKDREEVLRIPIGVVPAGSSNCLACSVGLRQPLAACFAIARGRVRPLDVLKVSLAGGAVLDPDAQPRVILSVCGVSYGFISEVNTFAGRWRWLFGPARYTVCGFKTMMASPMTYHVDCRFRDPDEDNPLFDQTECGPDCVLCPVHAAKMRRYSNLTSDPSVPTLPDSSYVSSLGVDSPVMSTAEPWTESVKVMEPRRRSLRPKAKTIDNSEVLLFSITNLSIRQSQNQTVWNANKHMASGYMDLVLMPVISRMRLLKFFKRYSKGDGRHKEDPAVFSITKTKSVEMKLTQTEAFSSWEKAIQLAIDGETYPLQPLRVDTLHGLLNFMIS